MEARAQLLRRQLDEGAMLPALVDRDARCTEDGDDACHPEDLRPAHENLG